MSAPINNIAYMEAKIDYLLKKFAPLDNEMSILRGSLALNKTDDICDTMKEEDWMSISIEKKDKKIIRLEKEKKELFNGLASALCIAENNLAAMETSLDIYNKYRNEYINEI